MHDIKHIWFDFSNTLCFTTEAHDLFAYQMYADAVGKAFSPEVVQEFDKLHKIYKSNSAVFTNGLGLPAGYWATCVERMDLSTFYKLADPSVSTVLDVLRKIVPLSIFSNMRMEKFLPAIGLNSTWFTHLVSSADFKNPKPALDGFYKIVEVSKLPAEHMLYIGDSIQKDIIPAKKVGMVTGIVWGESAEADYSFKNFNDILKVITNIVN